MKMLHKVSDKINTGHMIVVKTGEKIRITNWKENPEATCFNDSIFFYTKDGKSYTGDQIVLDLTDVHKRFGFIDRIINRLCRIFKKME